MNSALQKIWRWMKGPYRSKRKIFFRIATPFVVISILTYCVYLGAMYRKLEMAFQKIEEFVPTRIYSDVSRIAPAQKRSDIVRLLRSLNYKWKVSEDAMQIIFTLHKISYPTYLLPTNHPTLNLEDVPIRLVFDGTDSKALLDTIEIDDNEIPELFLEPELVATLARGSGDEVRELVGFQDIPAAMWQAIIAIEDQHFLEHKGLDPRGIARAILINLRHMSFKQGGSTLTQQLVKNLMVRRTKNLFKKITEVFLALLLEARFEKEQILERYLNEVYLGQIGNLEVHGVQEGAKYFFGKRIQELNLAEMAMMAGMIRGPSYYNPYRHLDRAKERMGLVLDKMVETKHIAPQEAAAAKELTIRLAPLAIVRNKAPYFTDFVKAELVRLLNGRMEEQEIVRAGFRVYTTLDLQLNQDAQDIVENGIKSLETRLGLDKLDIKDKEWLLEGALASVDHRTGYVKTLIGGKNYRYSTFNRILNMRRPVGSTFKPIVYLTAFRKGYDDKGIAYGGGYPIEDAPWTLIYDPDRKQWSPANYTREYRGWITLRTALINSINTAAAKLGVRVGIDEIRKTARSLGIKNGLPRVPSLSLGVAELSPVELLQAYATLANRGKRDELTVVRAITQDDGNAYARFVINEEQVLDPGPIDLLTDLMQDVFTRGTAKHATAYGWDRPSAGKTGTTSHHRDSWFAGFTPNMTTVVWVGLNDGIILDQDGKAKIRLTGGGSALPIWARFMKVAHSGVPPENFPISDLLTSVKINLQTGQEAEWTCSDDYTVVEKYLEEFEPLDSTCEELYPPSEPETILDAG